MINKLLRRYSFISHKNDTEPFMQAQTRDIEQKIHDYFRKTPIGVKKRWAGGVVTRIDSFKAVYNNGVDPPIEIVKNTNPMYLYQNPMIKAMWDESFSGVPPRSQNPVILGNEVIHNADIQSVVFNTEFVDARPCEYLYWKQQYIQTMTWIDGPRFIAGWDAWSIIFLI